MHQIISSTIHQEKKLKLLSLQKEFSILFEQKHNLETNEKPYLYALYIQMIGGRLFEIYRLQVEFQKLKFKVELLQAYVNRDEAPNIVAVQKEVDKAFIDYKKKIEDDIEKAKLAEKYLKSEVLDIEIVKEIKNLYRTIVKALHPDLNTAVGEREKILFLKAKEAYSLNDVEALREIEFVIKNSSQKSIIPYGIDEIIAKLEANIKNLIKEISAIENNFPFSYRDKLADKNRVDSEQKKADEEILSLKENINKIGLIIELLEEWKPKL